jgi:hypothetical protein
MSLMLAPQGAGNIFAGGTVLPVSDNAYACGATADRWTAVWAVNGTIQTSDPALKTDIAELPDAMPLLMAINPVTFRWKDGGSKPRTNRVMADMPVLDERGQPLVDMVAVLDQAGSPEMEEVVLPRRPGQQRRVEMRPKLRPVARTERREKEEVELVSHPGQRTHWGFLAPEIKRAFDAIGMDFGGYVKGDDGSQNLRPDQLIPVLWKCCQQMAREIEALKAAAAA